MSLPGDDALCWLLLLSVVVCLLSLLFFSGRVPGLIWFGSVYLVTTPGFVADQLMRHKQQTTIITAYRTVGEGGGTACMYGTSGVKSGTLNHCIVFPVAVAIYQDDR